MPTNVEHCKCRRARVWTLSLPGSAGKCGNIFGTVTISGMPHALHHHKPTGVGWWLEPWEFP